MCLCSFRAPARSTKSHTHSYTGGRGRHARCQPAAQCFLSKAPCSIYTLSLLTHSLAPQWNSPQEQFQVQCVRPGTIWRAARAVDWTGNPPISARSATFPEPQLPKKLQRIGNDVGLLLKVSFVSMTANVAADNTAVHCGKNWASMNICTG